MINPSAIPAERLDMLNTATLFHGAHRGGTGGPDCKHSVAHSQSRTRKRDQRRFARLGPRRTRTRTLAACVQPRSEGNRRRRPIEPGTMGTVAKDGRTESSLIALT